MLRDTSYALVRRLDFIESELREYSKKRDLSGIVIADIGCGTGELLTIPLALKLGKDASIYAYEPEAESYSHLCQQVEDSGLENITPIQETDLLQNRKYDAIIISEVLEHVESPLNFLRDFGKLLKKSGIMVITTPNGFGIFEIETLLFSSLELIGVIPFLRAAKRSFTRSPAAPIKPAHADTLAVSPHINFFTLGGLDQILREAGLSLMKVEGRNLAAGPFSDRIIDKSKYLIDLNSRLGKTLPLVFATDWMIIAENKETQVSSSRPPKKKGLNFLQKMYTNYKRWLNLYLAYKQRK